MPKAAGKWNTYEITAQGPHLVAIAQRAEDGRRRRTPSIVNAGPFALQYGSGVVKFRKVQIKPL